MCLYLINVKMVHVSCKVPVVGFKYVILVAYFSLFFSEISISRLNMAERSQTTNGQLRKVHELSSNRVVDLILLNISEGLFN